MNTKLTTAAIASVLLLAACGSDDEADTTDVPVDTAAAEPAEPAEPAEAEADADAYGPAETAETEAPAETSDDASGAVGTATTDLGDVLVDGNGLTLYGFTNDIDAVPSCFDACAEAWPPIILDSAELPAGLDPAVFSVVEREGDGFQLAAGVWPLYLFAGDSAAGDVNGQGVGGNWFAVAPDGSLVDAG